MIGLLILSALGILVLGGFLMHRVDLFMTRGSVIESPKGRANRGVLVYGAADLVPRIRRAGVQCGELTDPMLPEDGSYVALFALSGDDGKNIALCRGAKHADPGIYVIARCCDPNLCDAYGDAGADRILMAGESVDALITELWGNTQ